MSEIVAADIGGTHARFAIARVAGGRVASLGEECTLKTAEQPSLEAAWREYARRRGRPLPPAAAIAFAGPVDGEVVELTNHPWVIRRDEIPASLGVRRYVLLNDFGAQAHAVAQLGEGDFRHLCGPDLPLPEQGVISIVGPGTGLGVAQLWRRGGDYQVIETEGGHIGFAPQDGVEDRILAELRPRYGRVSVERLLSGPGLVNLHQALAAIGEGSAVPREERALWRAAMAGEDRFAAAALDRFCLILGAVAGDVALAQGAAALVVAGGLGQRLVGHLPASGFHARFVAKGRFERRMRAMPVKLLSHAQPGLFGAAAAFAARHGE